MQQWEYRVVQWQAENHGREIWSESGGQWGRVSHDSSWVPVLDELGGDGWELSGIVTLSAMSSRFVFKRPRP